MADVVEAVVDGGKANAGPLAPQLGPMGVNMGEIVAAINEKTKEFSGMKVPVKITVDAKKNFTIEVGTPPASALIKEKAGLQSGSGNAKTTMVGNITLDDAISVARMKEDDLLGADLKRKVREVVGTCVSMGITVEGANPREFQQRLGDGEFDSRF
jgi:large subunit ribosomal protein L11